MKDIKAFITVLGLTIVGVIEEETDAAYVLAHAFFLNPQQNGDAISPNFAPVAIFGPGEMAKGLECTLSKAHVLIRHDLHEKILEVYNRQIGAITVAPASVITELGDHKKKR